MLQRSRNDVCVEQNATEYVGYSGRGSLCDHTGNGQSGWMLMIKGIRPKSYALYRLIWLGYKDSNLN